MTQSLNSEMRLLTITVTPQRKFVVFVSSVTSEFGRLRQQLWESIYKAGHIPVVLEKYAGASADVRDHIERKLLTLTFSSSSLVANTGVATMRSSHRLLTTNLPRRSNCSFQSSFCRRISIIHLNRLMIISKRSK